MYIRLLNKEPLYDYRESCKITQGLMADEWQPVNETEYWIKQIIANHSTLRAVRFRIVASAPKSAVMQLIRATKGHPQPEVETSRPDWTGKPRGTDPYEEKIFMHDHTAESFIEMAKQRMCNRTEEKTRKFFAEIVENLKTSNEPFLRAVGYCCKPACEWYGAKCPELKGCGKYPKLSNQIIKDYKNTQNIIFK